VIIQNIISSFEEVSEHTDYERLFFWGGGGGGGGVGGRLGGHFSMSNVLCYNEEVSPWCFSHVPCLLQDYTTTNWGCAMLKCGEPSFIHPIVILVKSFGSEFSFLL
jgi:hypothetical protein